MLEICDLHVSFEGEAILKGIDLVINAGEIHVLMGPNGAGKSTLAKVLGGDPTFTVTRGAIVMDGEEIQNLSPEERAQKGLFLSFQDPIEVPGLNLEEFLRAITQRDIEEKMAQVGAPKEWLLRGLNQGFSGGEKKRSELLQLALLEPKVAILDELDSGLDVDALKSVTRVLRELHSAERAFLMITHYHRMLEHIKPDFVHVLMDGKIVKTGGPELAHHIEEKGYVNQN